MALDRRSIKKLMQDHFRGDHPLTVDAAACQALGEALRRRLAGIEGVEPHAHSHHYMSEQEKTRLVLTFRIPDPRLAHYSYYGGNDFRLLRDQDGVLTITDGYDARAMVSTLDEVVAFVLHCKQRLARLQALKAKRDKIRHLQAQAIIAQVKQLAKEEQFDFMTEADSQKLKLFVKLSVSHSLELHVPFKQFQEMLPQLRTVIVSLRTLYASGIRFKVVGRQALPWRHDWVVHTAL